MIFIMFNLSVIPIVAESAGTKLPMWERKTNNATYIKSSFKYEKIHTITNIKVFTLLMQLICMLNYKQAIKHNILVEGC